MTSNLDTMNPIDYLKFLVEETGGLLDAARHSLANVDQHCDADQFGKLIDDACDLIESAQREIVEAAAAFSRDGDDMATYADGRPVTVSCEIEPGCYFSYSFHPWPYHPDNRPRDIATVDSRDGVRRRIVLQSGRTIVAVPVDTLRVVASPDGDA